VTNVSLVAENYLPSDGSGKVIGIQHVPDIESVCIATFSGDVILCNTIKEELECVGSVDSGISCMSWSPDHELVVFSTGANTLIMMTRDFDPISEFPIHSSESGEEKPVNVGWGKRETQFHGSAGKPTAETLKPVVVNPVFDWDDKQSRISWRGDGQFFVVSAIEPDSGARKLTIWNREGVLMTSSEDVDGLEAPLCWKPSGNLIASTQRKPHRHDVVFFEKNGLRHGEFTLPFQRMEVKVNELQWNNDSTVLAVWLESMATEDCPDFIPKSYVQLWTVSNYHWYLKQELCFNATKEDRVACFVWDPEMPLRLHVVCRGGQYVCYEWCWAMSYSEGNSPANLSTVAIIDGAGLMLTPMHHMIVPPPMAAHTVAMPTAVQAVAFSPLPSCSNMAVLLSDGSIVFIDGSQKNGFVPPGDPPKVTATYCIDFSEVSGLWKGPLFLHHLTWWRENVLVAVGWDVMEQKDILCQLDIVKEESGKHNLKVSHIKHTDQSVLRMYRNPATGSLVVELNSGTIMKYTSDVNGIQLNPLINKRGEPINLPQPCVQLKTACVGDEEIVLGLTEHSRLYANDKEVATNCTSFAVHDEFLLLSTHAHTLRCISLLPSSKGLPVLTEDKPHPMDENVRRVERGSRIVVAVGQDTKVVLQMPRGNLETIHPRALVLSYLQKALDNFQYKVAFATMRRHRINLNLIYDHSPKLFTDNVETFVRHVESVNFLNLFLSDLNGNKLVPFFTLFRCSFLSICSSTDATSKVDLICDVVKVALEAMDNQRQVRYLLTILTSYVRKSDPELETVLKIIRDLRDKPLTGDKCVTSEDALKYVIFLVDVNQLYDVALGMYDFQLVLMVAEKSQKDPKEYLPFLNNLRVMEINYQRYTIDKYLKRHTKALQHLSKCGQEHFNELHHLVEEKCLYKESLGLFPRASEEHKTLAISYGDHLVNTQCYQQAGIVFARCGAHQKAMDAFVKKGHWQQVFCMAAMLGLTQENIIEIARNLAAMLFDLLKDAEEAVVALIEGYHWEEALRMIYKHSRVDIIETHLKTALHDGYTMYCEAIEQYSETFTKYKTRLQVVRETKERERLEILESGTLRDDTDADIYSDTSSMTGVSGYGSSVGSKGTRSTGRSSKNRRKLERKKYSLKEGSKNEDLALMFELGEIINQADKCK
ncbi:hypothetical protein QZH41_008724, partial [Actinostola sp. cb2023]